MYTEVDLCMKRRTQVGEKRVKVAGLLHAVADRRELVREVLATSLRRVKVRLNRHADAAAHDAIPVAPAQAGLHARNALVRHALQKADVD